MPVIGSLPEKLVLNPVQAVPLPKNYHFSYGFVPGWLPPRRDQVMLFIHDMPGVAVGTQDELGPHGFNTLLAALLGYVAQADLWGQTVPCVAVALAANGVEYLAKSNTRMLTLPARPCDIHHYLNLAYGPTDTPVPLGMVPPVGRKLYFRSVPWGPPSIIPKVWYVTPELRLEETVNGRGFDRFTFWLSVYGVPIKASAGVVNGELLAQRLNAQKSPVAPYSGTLDALASAVGSNLNSLNRTLMWTASRVVMVDAQSQPPVHAIEFDALGLHKEPLADWLAKEDKTVVWNFRWKPGAPQPPFGVATLP